MTESNKESGCRMSSSIQGALFDCDGTIIDSLGVWRGLEDILSQEAHIVVDPSLRTHFATLTVGEIAVYFHEKFGLGKSVDDVQRLIDEYMLDFYRNKATLLPGVVDFLESCVKASIRMSVVSSSKPAYLNAGLSHTGILGYFDAVVSVDDVGKSKREPDVYDYACSLLKTPRPLTWGFEDSLYALATLMKAGYPTVAIFDESEGISFEQLQERSTIAVQSFADLSIEMLKGPSSL